MIGNIERIDAIVNGNFVPIVPVSGTTYILLPEWGVDGVKEAGIFLPLLQGVMRGFSGAA